METRSRLQMKLLFCLADLLLIIVGSTVAQTCSCDLCRRCALGEQNHYLGNQNETARVFCQTASGAVAWQLLNPTRPISMGTFKYGGSSNRLDVFNVVGSDEGQYECMYTDSGTGQPTTDTACLFIPGTAVFASCRSQHCPVEMLTVQAGDELVIDVRIIFINSGPCMIPQTTTFLQLFKGDVIADNRLYECRDVEVCPPRMGSFEAVPAASEGGPINKFNFNLTKASAVMEDEGIYGVRVQVFNPRNAFAIITKTLSISVTAPEPPSIIVIPPQPVVTAVADGVQHNTTFNCTAVGSPTLRISWIHNMQNVSQNGRFQVMVTDDINHSSSTLAINSLTATDSGIIRCVANSSFGVDSADATLSVLTSDFNLSITVEASVRFVVTLFEGYIIPQPVMLRIILTSAEAARTGTRNITSETYVNTSRMIHEIPNSEVPYILFKAQVALTVGSEVGPFIPILDSASVYQIPRIETPPEPGVVAVTGGETQSTTFNCTAAAVNVTVLQILWIHNGQILSQSQRRVEIMEERGSLSLVTSRLTLHNLTAEDNGIIQCRADDPTDMTSTSANTTLSVLTDDFQFEAMVTEEGLILTVSLQTAIPAPVRLRIKYTWVVQPEAVEQRTSTTFENMREIVHEVSRSELPFQQFRLQVALQVAGVVGPFVPELANATVFTLPPPAQISGLIVALSVMVPFSVLLVIVISVTVPAVIFKMRKKKVETIQDYASTAIELLTKGNPIQLPPQPPPHPPPHLPRQHPRQCPPRLPSHDNTIITSESSSINDGHSQMQPEDLEHHRGSQNVSINTGKQKNKSETLPTSSQPSHPITRTDSPSQPSQPTTRTDTPSHLTTRDNTPSQPSQASRNGNDDHLTVEWIPTETSRKETSSKNNVGKISKEASSSGQQNMAGTVHERIATYESVGNVYDRIGTCETITPKTSAVHPTSRTDAPTQEETPSKNNISKRASFVNEEGQNVATAASVSNYQESSKLSPPVRASESVGISEGAKVTDLVHKKTPQLHGEGCSEQLGSVYERIATYETVGNVYDRIGTYETIGNVYDRIGTYETITATRSTAHSTPRSDIPTQEETASSDNSSERVNTNEGGLNMATTAGVSHFQESSKHSPPVCVSGEVGSSEGAKVTDLTTYETVGNVYDRICTYETVGNVYDNSLVPKLGFHEASM